MKNLLYISVILAGIVAIMEIGYLADSSLAFVILMLAVAVGLQGYYLIKDYEIR